MNKEQTVEEIAHEFAFNETNFPVSLTMNEINHCVEQVKNGFIAGAQWQQSQSGWVDVKERLPNDFTWKNKMISCTQEYQIYDEVFGISKAWLKKWNCDNSDTLIPRKKDEVLWECQHHNFNNVTHWQPLPKAPLNR